MELYHPDRKIPRIRPVKAFKHFRKLIENKEDTEQVFYIIEALNGRELAGDLADFASSDAGKRLIKERPHLPPLLDDHDTLKQLPDGTVGRAYVDFMEREGLTAQGLVDEFEKFAENFTRYDDLLEWYGNRRRDTHDLMHILTGYGRDALGEASVLAFSYGQNRGRGGLFIAYMAAREIKKVAPRGSPVFKSINEGWRNGKKALKLTEEDIPSLLAEPLEKARARMGILPPTHYQTVHQRFEQSGIDPYAVIAA